MIIDFHTHVFPPRLVEGRSAHSKRDTTLAALFANSNAPMATAGDLISAMDEAGVDAAVIMGVGWTDRGIAREANDYLLESAARYSGRLIPFCSVNPAWGEDALSEIDRCAASGARGVGELHPDTQGFKLEDSSLMDPFLDCLKSRNMVLLTHSSEPVGHVYPGKGSVTPAVLMEFIEKYADVAIVCSHWGGGLPFYSLMPEVKRALSNAYFDSAASPFLYRASIYSLMSKVARPGSILFGSDFPLLRPGRLMRHIRAADISAGEKEQILGRNAQRLLGL